MTRDGQPHDGRRMYILDVLVPAILAALLISGCGPSEPSGSAIATKTSAPVSGPSCGPDFELGDSRYSERLKAKKQQLLDDGYPADAVALLDRHGACVAAVERAPDAVSLKVIAADGSTRTMVWDADEERIAIDNLKNGSSKRFYRMIAARRFACCNEKQAEDQPDWDKNDAVNRSVVIRCEMKSSQVVCS